MTAATLVSSHRFVNRCSTAPRCFPYYCFGPSSSDRKSLFFRSSGSYSDAAGRGHDFFFNGRVHDVEVSRPSAEFSACIYLKSKGWASQKITTKYFQKIVFREDEHARDRPADVISTVCEGCPAGQNGGLCQHVFVALAAVEHYGPRRLTGSALAGGQSIPSLSQSWGPRKRDVEPRPF